MVLDIYIWSGIVVSPYLFNCPSKDGEEYKTMWKNLGIAVLILAVGFLIADKMGGISVNLGPGPAHAEGAPTTGETVQETATGSPAETELEGARNSSPNSSRATEGGSQLIRASTPLEVGSACGSTDTCVFIFPGGYSRSYEVSNFIGGQLDGSARGRPVPQGLEWQYRNTAVPPAGEASLPDGRKVYWWPNPSRR